MLRISHLPLVAKPLENFSTDDSIILNGFLIGSCNCILCLPYPVQKKAPLYSFMFITANIQTITNEIRDKWQFLVRQSTSWKKY